MACLLTSVRLAWKWKGSDDNETSATLKTFLTRALRLFLNEIDKALFGLRFLISSAGLFEMNIRLPK